MSFGFGVGDVLTVSKLAWDVYNAYKDAPGKFQNISHELKSLHIIIAREQDGLRNKTFDPEDQAELQQILLGCESVLRDLDNLLDKHKGLAAGEGSVSRFVVRVKLSFEDISELRARLVSNTLLFNTFMTRCAMDEMKDLITNSARAPGLRRAGSIASLASFASSLNSKAIWKKFCRDLHDGGVTAEDIRQKGPRVLACLRSGTAPVEGIGSAAELSRQGDEGGTTLGSDGALTGPMDAPLPGAAAGDADGARVLHKVLRVLDRRGTALHTAARIGYVGIMRLLLEQGANIANIEATRGDTGATVLIIAAYQGHASIVKLLLEKGANIEATRSDNGGTALDNAVRAGHASIVKLLLEKGANIEATRSYCGTAALDSAAYAGHVDVVRLLLEKGANIEAATSYSRSTALSSAADAGHADVVRLLLENGANIEATDICGATALDAAAYTGHASIVKLLLEKGANIEATRTDVGFTALNTAAYNGHADVVRLLLDNGASVDARTHDGSTALHLAAEKAHGEIVSLLLEKRASPHQTNHSGNTALHLILQNAGHSADRYVLHLILQNAGHSAERWKERIPTISLLLEYGANILHPNNKGQTPLSLAEALGFLDIKQLALKHTNTHDSTSVPLKNKLK